MDALIFLLPIALLLWLVLRGRKQQRAVADLQSSLLPGQRVMTTSGLYARIVEVSDTTVVLEPADGVRTTWARAAVARAVPEATSPDGSAEGSTAAPAAPEGAASTPDADAGAPVDLHKAPERPER